MGINYLCHRIVRIKWDNTKRDWQLAVAPSVSLPSRLLMEDENKEVKPRELT